jgi:hypothetical protein
MMTATEEKDIYGTLNAIAVAVCIICAGLASGLTQVSCKIDSTYYCAFLMSSLRV